MDSHIKEIDDLTVVRGFNRFYTHFLGLLDKGIYSSDYTLSEARILFEISKTSHCTANLLCGTLGLDRAYVSRVLARLEGSGLITRTVSERDKRSSIIRLSGRGVEVFAELTERSNRQVEELLAKLTPDERTKLIAAMQTIKKYLTKATVELRIRTHEAADTDYIIDRQLSLYEAERGFNSEIWTRYLKSGVRDLIAKFDPDTDRIYILEAGRVPSGCIAVTRIDRSTAQLRYFFVEPELRGLGAGKKLLDKAIEFCRDKKYEEAFLWTVSAQEAARRLYGDAGFVIAERHENDEWGTPVLEEKWSLRFTS